MDRLGPRAYRPVGRGVWSLAVAAVAAVAFSAACSKPQTFTSTVEITQTQVFGTGDAPTVMDVHMVFTECPGIQVKVVRGDKKFASCAKKLKKGDKVPVEILLQYKSDRGEYRNEVVKVDGCERTPDPKDDASYETVQTCSDVVINGAVTGVHCDRTRSDALVAKCPWFKRK
ncbi:MAG: hypothetical protein JST00_21930 [Deltaproteobacteria bacterium]|nr:hypothetical protein [Deltaproteobacteria bacterium]